MPDICYTLPNLLSFCRLLLAPCILWFVLRQGISQCLLIVWLAILTDIADGWLARRYQWQTTLGKTLDPLADKCFAMCFFVALTLINRLPLWIFLIILGREILFFIGAFLFFILKKTLLPHHWLGKINVGLQAMVGCMALLQSPLWLFKLCIVMMMAASLGTMFIYGYQGYRLLARTLH